MSKIWLTYAWKDNEDEDVDHVIHELQAKGIEVHYDRAKLLAGQRLWQQIDAAMNDPGVDAWAMFVSENSLKSEPCQEEIAYALDRCLRSGKGAFPLIGIFAAPLDRAIIPSALATRLYVNLRDPNWAMQVADGVRNAKSITSSAPPLPFGHKWHTMDGKPLLEVWPRSGRWFPFAVAVPKAEAPKFGCVMQGPKGGITGTGMTQSAGQIHDPAGEMVGETINHAITALDTAHIFFNERPSKVVFGEMKGRLFEIVEL